MIKKLIKLLVFWFFTQQEQFQLDKLKNREIIIKDIFTQIKNRIVKNILRKIYNFFILPFM